MALPHTLRSFRHDNVLARQVEVAVAARPSATLVAVRPAPEPGATTRVLFTADSLGESERLAVFVDPGTGSVVGELVTYGSSGVLPLRTVLDQVHANLLLGEFGRGYSELAASWLWVVASGGLVLWFARRRAARPKPAVRRHAVLGLWVLVGAVFLSATGLTWSKYAGENVADLRATFGWTTPALSMTGSGDHAGHTSGTPTGLVVLVVLGYRMWWQRRPTRGFGRPVPRGQWRKVPRAQLVVVLVVAAGVGWFVPLFGLSLLGFLVVDALLARRTAKPAPEPSEQPV
ncbi:hypothetical protein GCM10010492_65020 [Saccharothrix mutabilis subsp. mutabilis]|uniref:PepSY domain-containing protein n=1 Tax=Saccharothrix mutabilis subsp. mutabilis TaxID=66855 RepID=A0ABP3E7X3_9PSEU